MKKVKMRNINALTYTQGPPFSQPTEHTTMLYTSELRFLITMVRGQLVWKPSGIRENFTLLRLRNQSLFSPANPSPWTEQLDPTKYKYLVHWVNQEDEDLTNYVDSKMIDGLRKKKILRLKKEFSSRIEKMFTDDTHVVEDYFKGSIVLNYKELKKHPKYNEIIAQAVIT